MLTYGVAHFIVYVGAVFVASSWGLAAVAVTGVSVHLVFVLVAYQVLLHRRADRVVRFLWNDVSAACVSCVALIAVALPLNQVLTAAGAPTIVQLAIVSAVGAGTYLGALRLWFPADAGDLFKLIRRVVPHRRLAPLVRRVPGLAGRFT